MQQNNQFKIIAVTISFIIGIGVINSSIIKDDWAMMIFIISRVWPFLAKTKSNGYFVLGIVTDLSLGSVLFDASATQKFFLQLRIEQEAVVAAVICLAMNVLCLAIRVITKPSTGIAFLQFRSAYFDFSSKDHLKLGMMFCILGVLVTWLAVELGLVGRGLELRSDPLPFKLGGIINTLHITIIPFLFLILMESQLTKRHPDKTIRKVILMMFFMGIVQSLLVNSRGQFIMLMLPVAILFYVYSNRVLFSFKALILFFLTSIILVSVLTVVRDMKIDKESVELATAIEHTYSQMGDLIHLIYKRIFLQMDTFQKYYNFVSGSYVSFSEIMSVNGFREYHTRIIDRFPFGYPHSSGSASIGDAYLLFGWFGVILWAGISAFYFNYLWGPSILNQLFPLSVKVFIDWHVLVFCLGSSLFDFLLFNYFGLATFILVLLFGRLASRKTPKALSSESAKISTLHINR